MEPATAEEAVLARATELYAEGMSLEDANEPQLALDRYRRAVRMADERKILARLQVGKHDLATTCSSAALPKAAGTAATGAASAAAKESAEEEFQLWRAMHLSRLEAEVSGGIGAGSGPGQTTACRSSEDPPAEPGQAERKPAGKFAPAPRKSPTAAEREKEQETPEDAEEADCMALRSLQHGFSGRAEPSSPEDQSVEAACASDPVRDGVAAAMLFTTILPEVLPYIFSFLDRYGLDRTSPVCTILQRLTRESLLWCDLAKRCLTQAQYRDLWSSLGTGPGSGHLWRHALVFGPRFRKDGIYIAPCGYRRRIPKGSSLTDSRESMYIRYHRLIRVLPEDQALAEEPQQRALVLMYEGELTHAVEALKMHPTGRAATFGASGKALGETLGHIRKLQNRAILGTYSFNPEAMAISVRYTDARNEYLMEFALAHGRRDNSRQNCRLTWKRYEFTSLTLPQDGGSYDLRREQHYAPYVFARVRALEHLL